MTEFLRLLDWTTAHPWFSLSALLLWLVGLSAIIDAIKGR